MNQYIQFGPAILVPIVAIAAMALLFLNNRSQIRHLEWTANQELVKIILEIDKLVIGNPDLAWIAGPLLEPSIPHDSISVREEAFIYFHFNMFDVAISHYDTIRARSILYRSDRNRIDDQWKGWSRYINTFFSHPVLRSYYDKYAPLVYSDRFRQAIDAELELGLRGK